MNSETALTEAQVKANQKWFSEPANKPQTRKERLLTLAQKISQQNAENLNEMFEILKMKED